MAEFPLLSVVIPAYNAAQILERNLPVLISHLDGTGIPYEIVVADDGTPDQGETERICQRFHCIYFRHERNLGKGAAVRNGILMASGAFRIFTDADIPYDVEAIDQILGVLMDDRAPMAIGDRSLSGSVYFSEIPWFRRASSSFFTFFVGTIVTTDFYDTQCGIKGFSASTAETLFRRSRLNGFSFDVEIIYIALKQGIVIRKVPVRLRNQGASTVRVFRHGLHMFTDLFRIKYHQLRGYYK